MSCRSIIPSVFLAMACLAPCAGAAPVVIEFDRTYEDTGMEPMGDRPWLVARFEDMGQNQVRLFLENHLIDHERLNGIAFNLDPALSGGRDLVVSQVSGPDILMSATTNNRVDAGIATGFDVGIQWRNPINFHGHHGTAEFVLSGVEGLTAESFAFLNQDDDQRENLWAAAHVGQIGELRDCNAWVTGDLQIIPLPAAALLGFAGLGGVIWMRRRVNGETI